MFWKRRDRRGPRGVRGLDGVDVAASLALLLSRELRRPRSLFRRGSCRLRGAPACGEQRRHTSR
eukprot:9588026-Alexandrium_andersonii.AAC.1